MPLAAMVDTSSGLRPYLSDRRPQNGSPKKVPTEKAEKISAICQGGAPNDLAKNGSNGTMIPKPSMLRKMRPISESAAQGGGVASCGGVSDMAEVLGSAGGRGKVQPDILRRSAFGVGAAPQATRRKLRILPLQLGAEGRFGLRVEGLAAR